MSDVLVLSYHAVSARWPAHLSVTPARLQRQLELLVRRGYRGVTFSEAVTESSPENRVAVTFDDGYRSVFQRALPILSALGLPGTVFVPTGFVGTERPMAWPGIDRWLGGEHEQELVPLSWSELAELRDAGWEIGSHTRSHPYLTRLGDTELADELLDSRLVCEEKLGSCRALAYPFGDVDDRVVDATRRAGYAAACIVPHRLPSPEPLRWPRIGIYHADGTLVFRAKVSWHVRRLRGSAVWAVLDGSRRAVKHALGRS